MAANFAPYQDIPETQRAFSPPPQGVSSPHITSPRASLDRTRNVISPPGRTYEQHDYFGAGDQDSPDVERVAWTAPQPSARTGFGRDKLGLETGLRSMSGIFVAATSWRRLSVGYGASERLCAVSCVAEQSAVRVCLCDTHHI
jgi:hypothetical protein